MLGAVIVLGTIMSILDVTIVNVAIPTLGRDFHTSISTIALVAFGTNVLRSGDRNAVARFVGTLRVIGPFALAPLSFDGSEPTPPCHNVPSTAATGREFRDGHSYDERRHAVQSPRARRTRAGHHDVRDRRRVSDRRAVIVEIPVPGHALVVDSGWREVAHTALFVQRIVRSGAG